MAITDNRTLLDNANAETNFDDAAASPNGAASTETFIEGTASVGVKVSNTEDALLFDAGSAQDWSNNHFYIWWNVTTAGKLEPKSAGGVSMRFAASTITDFFEVNIDGTDTYSGGWKMSVVDIETALTSPSTIGGSGATSTNVRYVGLVFDMAGKVSGNVPNVFIDAIHRLPIDTPGIIVADQAGGPTDFTWSDILDAGDPSVSTKAWGTIFNKDGVFFVNTPIQFGTASTVADGFTDTNVVVAWEDQLVASTFYKLEIISGSSATHNFVAGVKTGSSDAATGSQGWVVTAAATGQRWSFVGESTTIDNLQLLGCTFQHTDDVNVDVANVELRSVTLLDGNGVQQSGSTLARCIIANANTADGTAYVLSDNTSAIRNNAFIFSDGHAIEITSTGEFGLVGNTFTGYGSSNTSDSAVFNNSGGTVTLNLSGGVSAPTILNGVSAATIINNSVTLSVTCRDEAGVKVQNARVYIEPSTSTGFLMNKLSSTTTGTASTAFNFTSTTNINIRVRRSSTAFGTKYFPFVGAGAIDGNGFTLSVRLIEDTIA